jgi:hypothetical protein
MREKLIKIIFGKLSMNLSEVEIIEHNDSIWFIDVDKKCWYLLYKKSDGVLWWRYDFFNDFFKLFSMEYVEYEPIITEWAEEVLNNKISFTYIGEGSREDGVEKVLNCNEN